MKVSIVTVCYNSSATIMQTIESVINQTYPDIEYILIDGGSSDGTVELIKKFGNKVACFVSEPDSGIYDAMNKGIKHATGEIIGILNSDDVYYSNQVISSVVKEFMDHGVAAVYGNVIISQYQDLKKPLRKWIAGKRKSFTWGWHPPHPALFIKNVCYKKFGLYKPKYKVSADFELMLRFFEVHKISTHFLDEVLVNMRFGGASTGSFKNIVLGNINIKKAFQENRIRYVWIYPFVRMAKKLFQFVQA